MKIGCSWRALWNKFITVRIKVNYWFHFVLVPHLMSLCPACPHFTDATARTFHISISCRNLFLLHIFESTIHWGCIVWFFVLFFFWLSEITDHKMKPKKQKKLYLVSSIFDTFYVPLNKRSQNGLLITGQFSLKFDYLVLHLF